MDHKYREQHALTKAVIRLDESANAGPHDGFISDGIAYTGFELRLAVAERIAAMTGRQVRLSRMSKRDVSLILAAHGASTFTIERHAQAIARLIRGSLSLAHGSWSASI